MAGMRSNGQPVHRRSGFRWFQDHHRLAYGEVEWGDGGVADGIRREGRRFHIPLRKRELLR